MEQFKPKRTRTKGRSIYVRILIVCVLVLIVLVGRAVWNVSVKERGVQKRLEIVADKHETLEARAMFLKEDIARLETDQGVEEAIRSSYGFGREGEEVVIVVDDAREGVLETGQDRRGFWRQIGEWFGMD